jgi:drug/metabolite transporter (DMT)-like permease
VSVAALLDWVAIFVVILALSYSIIIGDSHILSGSITSIPWNDWMILIGLAISGILGFLFITLSLQLICPSLVSSIRSLELVLASIVTSVLHRQTPSFLTIFGVSLVTSGVLILTFQDNISKKLKITNEDIRKHFSSCVSSRGYESFSV